MITHFATVQAIYTKNKEEASNNKQQL